MGRFSGVKNRVIAEGPWDESEDVDNMWKEITTHIRKDDYRGIWSN
jgi:hypothetical protein